MQIKILQKTVRSLGWCKGEKELNTLKQMAQKILVELSNDRQPTLPGMAEIFCSKEPAHCKKKHTTQNSKRKKKNISLFSHTNPQEKARAQYGIKGVCGAVYEQLDFHSSTMHLSRDFLSEISVPREEDEKVRDFIRSRIFLVWKIHIGVSLD